MNVSRDDRYYEDAINELKLKCNPQAQGDITEIKSLLKLLKFPSTELAELHRDAQRLGTYDLKEADDDSGDRNKRKEYCSDCGLVRQEKSLNFLCTSIEDVKHLGSTTYLLFQMMKKLILMTFALFAIYSLYAVITNVQAFENGNKQPTQSADNVTSSFQLSLGAKSFNNDASTQGYYVIQAWLGVVMILVWTILVVVMKKVQNQRSSDLTSRELTAADFSIVLENMPIKMERRQFQTQLNTYLQNQHDQKYKNQGFRQFEKIRVVKYNEGKYFRLIQNEQKSYLNDEYAKLIEEKEKKRKEIVDMLLFRQKNEYFEQQAQARKQIVLDYEFINKKIIFKNKEIAEQIQREYEKKEESPSTTVFVTFASIKQKQYVLSNVKTSAWRKFIGFLTCSTASSIQLSIIKDDTEYSVILLQAPEPEDIYWKNVGIESSQVRRRSYLTLLVTIIIIILSVVIQIAIDQGQQIYFPSDSLVIVKTIALIAVNIFLFVAIEKLSVYERNYIRTEYELSVSFKIALSNLVNSILTPIIVQMIYAEINIHDTYSSQGIADSVFTLALFSAILDPVFKILYFLYVKLCKICCISSQQLLELNQEQLNKLYENDPFNAGFQHISPIFVFIFTSFYVTLEPVIGAFALVNLIVTYYLLKFSLFHAANRPLPGNRRTNKVNNRIVYACGICYAIGNLYAIQLVPGSFTDGSKVPNIIAIVLGLFLFLFPFGSVVKRFSNYTEKDKDILYENYKYKLRFEYDRENPITRDKARSEFIGNVMRNGNPEEKKKLEDQMRISKLATSQDDKSILNYEQALQFYISEAHKIPVDPVANSYNGSVEVSEFNMFKNNSKKK